MPSFFQQVFNLLTTSPGNLAYHIILAFSVVGALQTVINHWRSSGFPQGKRTSIGLELAAAGPISPVRQYCTGMAECA